MTAFLVDQADYILFCYGLALVTLGAATYILAKRDFRQFDWKWLGLFGASHGLHEWLKVFVVDFGEMTSLNVPVVFLSVLSFAFLFEFGRTGIRKSFGFRLGPRIYTPLALITAFGGLAGIDGIDVASRYTFGLIGGILSAVALYSVRRDISTAGKWLGASGVLIGFYAIVTGLFVPPANFFPASVINAVSFQDFFRIPTYVIKAGLALMITLTVWIFSQAQSPETGSYNANAARRMIFNGSALFLIILFGWVITEVVAEHEKQEELSIGDLYVSTVAMHLVDNLEMGEHSSSEMAEEMAKLPIAAFRKETWSSPLSTRMRETFSHLSEIHGLPSDSPSFYLTDKDGNLLYECCGRARDNKTSAIIPVFRDILGTKKTDVPLPRGFYALDSALGDRSYYSISPVIKKGRLPSAYVLVRRPLDDIEATMKKHDLCFLVNPDGIIFLSSREDMIFKGLWPLDPSTRSRLVSSERFGHGPFLPVLNSEAVNDSYTRYGNKKMLVTRRSLGREKWSLILLASSYPILIFRLYTILTTLATYSMTLVFFGAYRISKDSAERIADSERHYRSLVEASPNCILLFDRNARCLAINRAGLDLVGFSESEIVGNTFDSLIFEGSRDMFRDAMSGALEGNKQLLQLEALRKDGSKIVFKSVLNPIVAQEEITSVVGVFVDITDLKDTEWQLRLYQDHLRELVESRTTELLDTNVRLENEIAERRLAEDAVRDNEIRFRSLFNLASEAIFLLDPGGRADSPIIVDANSAACSMNGYAREELVGRPMTFLDSTEDLEVNQDVSREILSGERVTFERRHVKKDGMVFPVEISAQLIQIGGNPYVISIERDVTERKRIERLIRESEERYKNLVELTPDIIYLTDSNGNYTYLNDAAYATLKYSPDEIIGGHWCMLFHADDMARCNEKFSEIIRLGADVSDFEARYVTKWGRPISVLHNIRVLRDEAGEITGFQGVARDITQRKNFEDSLKLFSQAIEEAMDGVQIVDLRGRIYYSNRAAEEIYGYSADEMIGMHVNSMNDDKDIAAQVILPNIQTTGRWNGEILVVHKNGRKFPIWLSASIVTGDDGQPMAMVGIIRDISAQKQIEEELRKHREHLVELVEGRTLELKKAVSLLTQEVNFRKAAEETLKESEEKFRRLSQEFNTLLDAIPDYLLLLSPELEIMWANKSAAAEFGQPMDEIIGRQCHMLWHGNTDPCDDCHVLRCFRTGSAEFSIRTMAGNRILDSRAFPIKDTEGRVINTILVVTDITEKTNLQAEALRASHLASLGELAAGVAHEINNPINGIINYAQILANRNPEGSSSHEIAERVMKEGQRIAGIVRGLLSFAREKKEEKAPCSIAKIIEDTFTLTGAQVLKDGIHINIDLDGKLPQIIANPQQLQQVFLNIISNARYALNKKHPVSSDNKRIDISGRTFSLEGNQFIKITFRDYGTGIPAEILDRVMNPFFSTKPSGQGTGLGLSVSHGIIRNHDGRLFIESREGEYTEVVIYLPVMVENG